jgi:hypothetical protein
MLGQFTPTRWDIVALQKTGHLQSCADLASPLLYLAVIGLLGSLAAHVLFKRQFMGGKSR